MPHFLGWDPRRAVDAKAEMLAGKYCTVLADAKYPPAWSNSANRLRQLMQGQAGTCWEHAGVFLAETAMKTLGYLPFPICRRLVGWAGKMLEGGGNQTDGGSPTDALRAMTSDTGGVGIAHENLCPYPTGNQFQMRAALGPKPPDLVFVDAKASHLVAPVDVRSDDDSRVLIASGRNAANGIWWPSGWDAGQTFMTSIGGGGYGHALDEFGYVMPGVWDDFDWWQLENWHGLLYPPLPADKAAKVPGYMPVTPTKTSDFWVRGDVYRHVQQKGGFERVSATDLDGIGKVVQWSYKDFL